MRVQTDGSTVPWAREELDSRRTRAYDARARDDRASWDVWVRACEYMPREAIVAAEETEAYFERKARSQAVAEEMDAAFEREDRDIEALILEVDAVAASGPKRM